MRVALSLHPLFDPRLFITRFSGPLGELTADIGFVAGAASDDSRAAVRDLLRHGGFKPTGRSKPASEYLEKAVAEGRLSSINLAVDACNAASLHTGLPVSVIDLEKISGALHLRLAPAGTSYVFNASEQTIDVGGLLCLFDESGPCANAVKDSQRTKTSPATRTTLSVIWGTNGLPGRSQQCADWYSQLLQRHGAAIEPITPETV